MLNCASMLKIDTLPSGCLLPKYFLRFVTFPNNNQFNTKHSPYLSAWITQFCKLFVVIMLENQLGFDFNKLSNSTEMFQEMSPGFQLHFTRACFFSHFTKEDKIFSSFQGVSDICQCWNRPLDRYFNICTSCPVA